MQMLAAATLPDIAAIRTRPRLARIARRPRQAVKYPAGKRTATTTTLPGPTDARPVISLGPRHRMPSAVLSLQASARQRSGLDENGYVEVRYWSPEGAAAEQVTARTRCFFCFDFSAESGG